MSKVFLDFYADWCQPCKIMTPIIDDLEKQHGDVEFKKIDVDKNTDMASQYQIMSIPTFVIEQDGKELARYTGIQSKHLLSSKLRE